MRDEISLMLDGNAFQARGPSMEKALEHFNFWIRTTKIAGLYL